MIVKLKIFKPKISPHSFSAPGNEMDIDPYPHLGTGIAMDPYKIEKDMYENIYEKQI